MLAVVARCARTALACALIAVFAVPQDALADEHVVRPSDLHRQAVAAAKSRQEKIQSVQKFFASEKAKQVLKAAGMDAERVRNAVAQMSDEELAQLAARTEAAQKDFAGGALTNQEITYIIIALATAVIVIVLLKA